MDGSQIYILIAVIVLASIFLILLLTRKKRRKPLSALASFAFAFMIAGIAFGENRLLGYGLIGMGIILALIDIVRQYRK